ITVKKLIESLRKADIDIAGAEESLRAAELAMEKRQFDDVDVILANLDSTAKELLGELVAAAKNLITRAERRIKDARAKGLRVDEPVTLLDTAEGHFERAEYADAVGHARAAEQKVIYALKVLAEQAKESRRKAQETARARIAAIRKTITDLSRADISILGAEQALSQADAAFESGRFEEVPAVLAETEEMALALTQGLESAATDLVKSVARGMQETRSSGTDPRRADGELGLARRHALTASGHTFAPCSEDGLSMGVPRGELEEFRTRAQDAADADDLQEVYRLKGDLQERLLEAKRKQIVKRSMDEVQTLDEIVTQTERLDIPAESAGTRLDHTRQAT